MPFYKIFTLATDVDFSSIYKVLREDYDKVLKIYSVLSAHTYCYPLIDVDTIDTFVRKARIIGDQHLDYEDIQQAHRDIFDGQRENVNRVQFLEFILRLVNAKH